jgi:hypothetical protein
LTENEVLISIAPSQGRRWLAIVSIAGVGILFLALGFEVDGLVRLAFLGCAILAAFLADRLRRATADRLELTREELRTASGRHLARVENVKGVDRGAFAFKPSHGFLVKLKEPEGGGWAPGLFWQRGRLLGVGGVIGGGETRAMAEILTALIQGDLTDAALED